MNKNTPRYKDNIFVKDKKHILRTLNTYSKYQDVLKIYVIFNDEYEKYQLLLECESDSKNDKKANDQTDTGKKQESKDKQTYSKNKSADEKNQLSLKGDKLAKKEAKKQLNNKMLESKERKLVYERTNSKISLRDEKTILSVVNSRLTKNNLQPETIEALSELIKKCQIATILNTFFEDSKENARIEEIGKILPVDLKKEYKSECEDKSFKTNVEKRIYYLIKNQLTYSDLGELNRLKDGEKKIKRTIQQKIIAKNKEIDEEMKILEQNIKSLMGYSFQYSGESSASKIEIEKAIKHIDDPYYNKYNLEAWSLAELKQELYRIEKKEALMSPEEKLEIRTVQDFAKSMKECLDISYKREFESYNSVITFCKENGLFLDDDAIYQYIKMVNKLYKEVRNKIAPGGKRIKALDILNKQYPYFIEMKSTDNYYFRSKITRLHKFVLQYKDKYHFNINYKDFEQVTLAKEYRLENYTKEELEKMGLDLGMVIEINEGKREEAIRVNKKKRKLEELGLTEEQENFNVFYEKLLNHIDEIIESKCRPLTIEYFEEYLDFISDIKKVEKHYTEAIGFYDSGYFVTSCTDMKEEISDYLHEIYERIDEDLIAAGIDPNESEEDEDDEIPF